MNNKTPKKNIILILILIMIVLSLMHSWYHVYKVIEKVFKTNNISITMDVNLDLPDNGIYYNEEHDVCIVIYSLEIPLIISNATGHVIIDDNYITKNYIKIIDYSSDHRYIDYKLIGSIEPYSHYYLYGTDYQICKTDNGIILNRTLDDGSIVTSIDYKKIK